MLIFNFHFPLINIQIYMVILFQEWDLITQLINGFR